MYVSSLSEFQSYDCTFYYLPLVVCVTCVFVYHYIYIKKKKDGVQGYWLKKLTALHERIAKQFDNIISNPEDIPKWMTLGKTVLCQKHPSKGNAVDNYRPISCLPLM